jgi:hypothetical protein
MRGFLLSLSVFSVVAFGVAACGSESETSGQGGAAATDDGLFHPPPNGVHKAEDVACGALKDSALSLRVKLKCVGTAPACPGLVRKVARVQGSACYEYDEGAVKGCVDYYKEQPGCDELGVAIDRCVVVPYDCPVN